MATQGGYSLMVIAKVQESRTSCASLVQVSPYVTFTDIPRIRTDDTAIRESNGPSPQSTPPTMVKPWQGCGREQLLEGNEELQPMARLLQWD